ncbi:MAG: hypothetical protein ACK4FB_04650 [Brevundimonas sp.]|uniref:hypothetical protein n=1 Tax=Brevundimonas sp. TaxID=1871086 RepID=UPI00391C7959
MNAQRFQDLADAYGADLRRWPEAERGAAGAFMDSDPQGAERLLFEARQMDLALDAAPRPMVSHALREQVIALAAAAGLRPRARRFGFGRFAWMSGAGWAAACAAGIMVGVNLSDQALAHAEADLVLYQAGLEALDDTEVLG